MSNPIESRAEIELKRTLDMIDFLLEAVQREANKLPYTWQEEHCDAFTDKLTDAKRIAKEATGL